MAETMIHIYWERSYDVDPKYTSAKFIICVPFVSTLTINSIGSAGHDIRIQPQDKNWPGWPQWKYSYYVERDCKPLIQTLNLNGTRIRLQDLCLRYSIDWLNIRCNNFNYTNPSEFPTVRSFQ